MVDLGSVPYADPVRQRKAVAASRQRRRERDRVERIRASARTLFDRRRDALAAAEAVALEGLEARTDGGIASALAARLAALETVRRLRAEWSIPDPPGGVDAPGPGDADAGRRGD